MERFDERLENLNLEESKDIGLDLVGKKPVQAEEEPIEDECS